MHAVITCIIGTSCKLDLWNRLNCQLILQFLVLCMVIYKLMKTPFRLMWTTWMFTLHLCPLDRSNVFSWGLQFLFILTIIVLKYLDPHWHKQWIEENKQEKKNLKNTWRQFSVKTVHIQYNSWLNTV